MIKRNLIPAFFLAFITAGTILPASAKESLAAVEKLTQEYNDAQFCAALLKRVGGEENLKKSKVALAYSKKIAPLIGHTSEKDFNQSYSDVAGIISNADKEEMEQFSELCLSAW
ncbi:hypothetical protein [Bordetella trematum]|uniref:hypothetical protein n=1 Tax=Bordetella trematum TaxID=123899 RepID=UPI0015C57959|nr:hypothetical protein [Bordetella trematum]